MNVDSFGDNLMSVTNIPGDSFRHRHDKVKTVLNRFCLTSSIKAECEVFGVLEISYQSRLLGRVALNVEGGVKDSYLTSKWSCPLPRVRQ